MIHIAKQIILSYLKNPKRELDAVRRDVLRGKKSTEDIPKSDLLKAYHNLVRERKIKRDLALETLLIKRGVRTLSGVAIVTNLTKPYGCPGKCVYCPTEAQMPKSYLSDEPAAARALALQFDPFEQTWRRLQTLEQNGHPTDKVELIIKGGTWNCYPVDYQYWFILRCFEAANGMKTLKHENIKTLKHNYDPTFQHSNLPTGQAGIPTSKLLNNESLSKLKAKLILAQRTNERSKYRIIGLTLETRPDFINEKNIEIMRELGCTRVELGVQTIDDKILKTIRRGHDSAEIRRATAILKNSGFKVDYHLMPQLPGSTPAKDLKMMLEIFSNPDYRPDMIKIYPCTVIKGTELYRWLKAGKYKPYSDKKLVETIIQFKTQITRYCRVSRLIRDIPSGHIMGGNKVTNLRQVIQAEMARRGLKCNCLRCREVGHQNENPKSQITNHKKITNPKLFVDKYKASGGIEYFLSYEDPKRQVVFAFCRLRLLTKSYKLQVTSYKAYLRELHTYGQLISLKHENIKTLKQDSDVQHTGMGKALMLRAEEICRKNKVKKLAVISGVGVRGYYRKQGYRLENGYMVKKLTA